MTKKTKIIAIVSAVAATVAAATVGVIAFGKRRAKKFYANLMKDMEACGFGTCSGDGEGSHADSIELANEKRFHTFTYWIPIPDKGSTYEANLKILLTAFMKMNNIICLDKDPFVTIFGRRIYITTLSPKRSKKTEAEIVELLDAFYKKYCSNDVYEPDHDSYIQMKDEFPSNSENASEYKKDDHNYKMCIERKRTSVDHVENVPTIITITAEDIDNLLRYLKAHLAEYGIADEISFYDEITDAVIFSFNDTTIRRPLGSVVDIEIGISTIIELLYAYYYHYNDKNSFTIGGWGRGIHLIIPARIKDETITKIESSTVSYNIDATNAYEIVEETDKIVTIRIGSDYLNIEWFQDMLERLQESYSD